MGAWSFLRHHRPWARPRRRDGRSSSSSSSCWDRSTTTSRPTVPALVLVLPVVVAGGVGGRLAAVVGGDRGGARAWRSPSSPRSCRRVSWRRTWWPLVVFLIVAVVVGDLVGSVASADRQRLAAEAAASPLSRSWTGTGPRSCGPCRTTCGRRWPPSGPWPPTCESGTEYDDATRDELLDLVSAEAERLDRIVGNLLEPEPDRGRHVPAGPPGRRPGRAGHRQRPTACDRVLERLRRRARPRPTTCPSCPADYSPDRPGR